MATVSFHLETFALSYVFMPDNPPCLAFFCCAAIAATFKGDAPETTTSTFPSCDLVAQVLHTDDAARTCEAHMAINIGNVTYPAR